MVQYFTLHQSVLDSGTAATKNQQLGWLNKIFAILRTRVGHDFSAYKPNTILRRINRRMGLSQVDSHQQYVRYLRENSEEVESLFRELLIGVTQFFRDPDPHPVDMARMAQQAILDQFAPTAILIDPKGNILHVQGRTGMYLETPSGAPTHNILHLAREGLRIDLSSAIRRVVVSDKPVVTRKIAVKTNGHVQMINLHVSPQQSSKALCGFLLVVFENIGAPAMASDVQPAATHDLPGESSRNIELEQELLNIRESHQVTIEELESSNEELKSTNEELQSANEELQSTNEELESSREELQSLNEELQTVNAEMLSKVEEPSATHDDMRNLLNSTQIATIFVDNQLCVRRFTREATSIVNLIETDVGRPLQHPGPENSPGDSG